MSGVSITGLDSASTLTGSEIVPIVQSGTTVRTTLAAMPYVPAGTSAVTTTVQAKLRETVSVEDFGAVGDGSDETTKIQNALDASAGKTLIFPAGNNTYVISNELTVSSNTYIDLGGNTIKQATAAQTENGLFFIASGKSNIKIENGTIDVNVANQGYTQAKSDYGRGILVYSASYVTIKKIKFINPYGSMVLSAASSNVIIDGCDINDVNATGYYALMFNTCSSCDVIRCTGTGKVATTGYGIYATGTCTKIRALDNVFTYWQIVFAGFDYISGGGASGMAYCFIERNILIEPSADTSIHFGVYSSVSDNIIINSHDVGISIDFTIRSVCNNNVIRTTNASGIAIPGCVDVVVDGNMLSNPGSEWISSVTAGQRCGVWAPNTPTGAAPYQTPVGNVISNNTIRDDLGTHKMYYGIYIQDVSGNNVNNVRGNYIAGAASSNYLMPVQTNIGELEAIKTPTLLNSWVNYGTPYVDLGYCKTEDSLVFLRGMVKSGTVGAIIFTLPEYYRPSNQLIFNVITSTGSGRLDIFQNGDVVLVSGGNGFVSLSGISFPTR